MSYRRQNFTLLQPKSVGNGLPWGAEQMPLAKDYTFTGSKVQEMDCEIPLASSWGTLGYIGTHL